jgi:hypothetical protein
MVKLSQMVVVFVLKVHSLMEQDVKLKQLINVSVFLIRIGMELIVIVKEDIVQMEHHVIVKVLLWEIIVKDVPLNLIHSIKMVFVNVILDMFN